MHEKMFECSKYDYYYNYILPQEINEEIEEEIEEERKQINSVLIQEKQYDDTEK